MTDKTSAQLRAGLDHPVIDIDGHWIEFLPVFRQYVRDICGSAIAEKFEASRYYHHLEITGLGGWNQGDVAQRRDMWTNKGIFWSFPTKNTLDRATAMLPALMAERLDEMGIDVAVLYPTLGMHVFNIEDEEVMLGATRAFNTYAMDQMRPHSDRLVPVAMIPMETPSQALDELDHAVNVLGYKAVLLQQFASRPIAGVEREHPGAAGLLTRPDYWGLDSAYDYDPVWARCIELGVAATFHALGRGALRPRGSISNQIYNRVGSFGLQHHRLAAALYLGGVTRRFPELNVAFLEGGVAWATTLFADLVGLWDKRNAGALGDLDPRNLDQERLFALAEKYGDERIRAKVDEIREHFGTAVPPIPADQMDEFSALGIEAPEDLSRLFAEPFYFGCEGDDAMNALAFRSDLLPFGASLKACYGSDIGHWDVHDMTESVEEAYEPVDDGLIDAGQFRDFVFTNPATMHAGMNPEFFKGTRADAAVAELLSAQGAAGA